MSRQEARQKRKNRVRKKVSGTSARPRMSVFRSSRQLYAQLIDDVNGRTLAAASSLDPMIRDEAVAGITMAEKVGQLLGERATAAGIEFVVFDRSGYRYHGLIKALADGAREKGLQF